MIHVLNMKKLKEMRVESVPGFINMEIIGSCAESFLC